jgi:hypothetical protein
MGRISDGLLALFGEKQSSSKPLPSDTAAGSAPGNTLVQIMSFELHYLDYELMNFFFLIIHHSCWCDAKNFKLASVELD